MSYYKRRQRLAERRERARQYLEACGVAIDGPKTAAALNGLTYFRCGCVIAHRPRTGTGGRKDGKKPPEVLCSRHAPALGRVGLGGSLEVNE